MNARNGAGDNQFGVLPGHLRGLAKKLTTDHDLAMQLWETGNFDAMILAAMLMAGDRLSDAEGERMVRSLTCYRLVDELTYNAVTHAPFERALRARWVHSPDELTGRAG